MKKMWFEGSVLVKCRIEDIELSSENMGEFLRGATSFMPGLKSVELVEQGTDNVIIKTNEGLMKRTNITKDSKPDRVVIEFDEEYQAGRMLTTTSHHSNEFTMTDKGLILKTVISDLNAPGVIGFLYKSFGSKNIGTGILESYKSYIESKKD